MNIIEEIKNSIKLDVRPISRGNEYLEAVFSSDDLETVDEILKKHLGVATKLAGHAGYPPQAERTVSSIGGLRKGQSFYFKEQGNTVIFAALWPWETNPGKITLKMGIRPLLFP